MIREGSSFSSSAVTTYVRGLKECIRNKALGDGKLIHARILEIGLGTNTLLGNALLNMYAQCGSLNLAWDAFHQLPAPDVFSWTILIYACTKRGYCPEAFALFEQMQVESAAGLAGVRPNERTYVGVLKACMDIGQGKLVHAGVERNGFPPNVFLRSALVEMYARFGSLGNARRVFDGMAERDVVSWTEMIDGYARHGRCEEALALFKTMQLEGVKPDRVALVSTLKACASLATLEEGKQVHAVAAKNGFQLDVVVANTLIDMYSKSGSVEDAWHVFRRIDKRTIVSWTAMIAGYAQHVGHAVKALALFEKMQKEDVKPNEVTFVSVLKACSALADLEWGKWVHASIRESKLESNVFVGSTLIDMYAKCGSIEEARQVFDRMLDRNVVSWTAMIAGYAQHGHGKEALSLFREMQGIGVKPNELTLVAALKACASLATLEEGKRIHASIKKQRFESNIFVVSSLVDMYAKCGSIEDARQVFDGMHKRNVVLWNAMIAGYAQHGHSKEALSLFEKLQQEGVKPDGATFISVLSACSHEGLVDEAYHIFESMCQDHGITLTIEHYACMVDLLGRMGHLVEAEEFIKKMPIEPHVTIWRSLLGACKMHGNVELGRRTFECIRKLEPTDAVAYVVLSNIYAAAGQWDEVAKLRKEREDAGLFRWLD